MKKTNNPKKMYTASIYLLLAFMVALSFIGIRIFKVQYDRYNISKDSSQNVQYEKYYAMITSNDRADFWQAVYAGAEEEGNARNACVELFASDIGNDYSIEERVDIAIASGVDGIILEGEENIDLRRMMKKAIKNGIPVVTVSQDVAGTNRISYVGISRYELGIAYGKELVKLAKQMVADTSLSKGETGTLNAMVLLGAESDSAGQNLLLSGIKEEIAKDRNLEKRIKLETYTIDDSGAFTAEESIRDVFVGRDYAPDMIVCLNEIHTNCAYQAVIDYNRVGRTNVIGYYDSESILNAVKKEVVYSTISMDTKQMGTYCVEALSDYLDEGYVSDYYAVDTYIVDKKNIEQYLKEGEE